MSAYDVITKLLVAKDRLMYHLDDHAFCLHRLLANLLAGHGWRRSLEETEAEWTEFAQERRRRAIERAHQDDLVWAREIEEEWIPRHVQEVKQGSPQDIAKLLQHCRMIRQMDLSVHNRAFREAVERWTQAIEAAVKARG